MRTQFDRARAICVGFVFFLIHSVGHSQVVQDDTINVLLVADLGTLNAAVLESQVSALENAWINVETRTGVSMLLLNNGEPLEYQGTDPLDFVLAGYGWQQLNQLVAFGSRKTDIAVPTSPTIREFYMADLIVGITNSITYIPGVDPCGQAQADQWLGDDAKFIPNPVEFGWDRRGAGTGSDVWPFPMFEGHVVVAENNGCNGYSVLIHEIGHALGAAHYDEVNEHTIDEDNGNRADGREHPISPWHTMAYVTAVATGDDSICQGVDWCQWLPNFSNSVLYGHPNRNNLDDAINVTADSVANYMRGHPQLIAETCSDGMDNDGDGFVDNGDAECAIGAEPTESGPPIQPPPVCDSTVAPSNVEGYLVEICAVSQGYTPTKYRAHWYHGSPSQVDYYEVWESQPDGVPFVFDNWTTTVPYSDVFIDGAPGRLKVRSCGPAGCSALSVGSFLAVDQC